MYCGHFCIELMYCGPFIHIEVIYCERFHIELMYCGPFIHNKVYCGHFSVLNGYIVDRNPFVYYGAFSLLNL